MNKRQFDVLLLVFTIASKICVIIRQPSLSDVIKVKYFQRKAKTLRMKILIYSKRKLFKGFKRKLILLTVINNYNILTSIFNFLFHCIRYIS